MRMRTCGSGIVQELENFLTPALNQYSEACGLWKLIQTFGSVTALNRLSISGDNVFSRGTMRAGRFAGRGASHVRTYGECGVDLPVMLSRKYSGE